MNSKSETGNSEEWEEVIMMMELPNGANLNTTKKDLYLQVAGMWSETPVIKLDNMLYAGKVSETIGSHLFIESKIENGTKQTQQNKKAEREILVANANVMLEPIYLERKTDQSSSSHDANNKSSTDLEKT